MRLLYGTANPAKLEHMREMLDGLNIDIVGLNDVAARDIEIEEVGSSPLENARLKALAYYRAYRMPVFSCDSGLYIDGLENDRQPGVQVRRVNGKRLTDDEMIEYYSSLALELGGNAEARYRNSICLILDEGNVFEYEGEDIFGERFIITSKPHEKRVPGFPLDSLSIDIKTGKYYFDLERDESSTDESSIAKGFRSFFTRSIPQLCASLKVKAAGK